MSLFLPIAQRKTRRILAILGASVLTGFTAGPVFAAQSPNVPVSVPKHVHVEPILTLPVALSAPSNESSNIKPTATLAFTVDTQSAAFSRIREIFQPNGQDAQSPTAAHHDGQPKIGVVITGPTGRQLYTFDHGLSYSATTHLLTLSHQTVWSRYTTYTVQVLVTGALQQYLAQQTQAPQARQTAGGQQPAHYPPQDVYTGSFTTGSAIGEPVQWTASLASAKPSVITGDSVTVTAQDSYGDPATSGSFTVSATGLPTLASSFQAPSGIITNGQGQSLITDHQAQAVTMTVKTAGPYAGHDDHTIVLNPVTFQPGPPAQMTVTGPATENAGGHATEQGIVEDVYGNPVNPSVLDWTTNAGSMDSSITTAAGGTYQTILTDPTKLTSTPGTAETVMIDGHSVQGTATASGTIQIDPGPVAQLTLAGNAVVQPGHTETLAGTAIDSYGNAVLNGTPITLTATGGTIADANTQGGGFSATYTAPNTPGQVIITASANGQTKTLAITIPNPVSAGSTVSLNTPVVESSGAMTVTGTVKTASGSPVDSALVSLTATGGTLQTAQTLTNSQGQFTATVQPSASGSAVTVTATTTTASGSAIQGQAGIDPLVYGNQAWTDTGISVQAGQEVTITSTGSWADSLYASIGGSAGTAVQVGSNGTFVAGTSGTLYLGTNGTTQSGSVDALVGVSGLSNVVPTMDLTTSAATVAPSGTAAIAGQVMMGTTPVAGASVTLTTTAGTLNDPATSVTATTNGQGQFTATFNAPASGSATVTAQYTPPTGNAISQSVTETIDGQSLSLSTQFSSAYGVGTGNNQWEWVRNVAPTTPYPFNSSESYYTGTSTSGLYSGLYQASGISGTGGLVKDTVLAPTGTTFTQLSFNGYLYNGVTSVFSPRIVALVDANGSVQTQNVWTIPTVSGFQISNTPITVSLPSDTVGVVVEAAVQGSYDAASWAFLLNHPMVTLSSGSGASINTYGLWTTSSTSGTPSGTTSSTSTPVPSGMSGVPVPSGTIATASSTYSTDVAANAINGNLTNAWNSGGYSGTLTLQFPSDQQISAVGVAANGFPASTETYTVQGLVNGQWETIANASPYISSTSTTTAYFTIPVTPGTYTGLRFIINGEASWVAINNITLIPANS